MAGRFRSRIRRSGLTVGSRGRRTPTGAAPRRPEGLQDTCGRPLRVPAAPPEASTAGPALTRYTPAPPRLPPCPVTLIGEHSGSPRRAPSVLAVARPGLVQDPQRKLPTGIQSGPTEWGSRHEQGDDQDEAHHGRPGHPPARPPRHPPPGRRHTAHDRRAAAHARTTRAGPHRTARDAPAPRGPGRPAGTALGRQPAAAAVRPSPSHGRPSRSPPRPSAAHPGSLAPPTCSPTVSLAVLSGQRPVHCMLRHTAGRAYDELAWLAERGPLPRPRHPPRRPRLRLLRAPPGRRRGLRPHRRGRPAPRHGLPPGTGPRPPLALHRRGTGRRPHARTRTSD